MSTARTTLALCIWLIVNPLPAESAIEDLVLGPANEGGAYVVSQQNAQVAYVGMHGTNLYVSVDGKEGPLFDEFFSPSGASTHLIAKTMVYNANSGGQQAGIGLWPVVFTEDGSHYAYIGRQGADYVVIHDGKGVGRGSRKMLALDYGPLTISPKGQHVYWEEMERGARSKWRLLMDGKPGPWSGHQTMLPVFDPEQEKHYAYTAGTLEDYQQQMLIVDGAQANYVGIKPVYTSDGKKLITITQPSVKNPKTALLVNGDPVIPHPIKDVVTSQVGGHFAAIAVPRLEGAMGVDAMFLDGKRVANTDGVQKIWFSPDGNHWAAACNNRAARSMFMVIDGKPQKEYTGVNTNEVYWTSDSSRFIYTVNSGGRSFLVVDGQERAIQYLALAVAEKGSRFGYHTWDGSNQIHDVVIEDKSVLPKGYRPMGNVPTFSPDGSRYAFQVGPLNRNERVGVVIDGVLQTDMRPESFFTSQRSVKDQAVSFIFSPDSKHIAYINNASQHTAGIYVDGKLVYNTSQPVYFLRFTPDSRHLFWIATHKATVPGKAGTHVVYVDGKSTVSGDSQFFSGANAWSFDEKGVLTFLAASDDKVKRYRLTASADTSIDAMIESAEAARANTAAARKEDQQRAAQSAADKKLQEAQAAAEAKAAQQERVDEAKKARMEALEAKKKARQEALNAQKLNALNTKRAKQGLPPLTQLP
jgi:hypothetical protein